MLEGQLEKIEEKPSHHTDKRNERALHILAFFWHPPTTIPVGAFRRFIGVLGYLEDYDVEYDAIENQPTVLPKNMQHRVYKFKTPFHYSGYITKFLTMFSAALVMTFIGISTCHKKRYDLLIAPTGELTCTIVPVYVTHLVTGIPWTTMVCNVPEAYPLIDSRGQLVVSISEIYKHYRSLGLGAANALLLTVYSYLPKLLLPKIYNKAKAILCLNKSLSLYLQSLGTRREIFPVGMSLNVNVTPNNGTQRVQPYSAIFLGRFVPEKGVFDALRAWHKVTKAFPQATLFLAGHSDEVQLSAVKNMIKELDITENVRILGTIGEEEKYRFLKSSYLFLFLSKFESFGLVIAEAMACGLPVVGYDAPFMRELFACPSVLRAPIGDVDSVAELVCELMRDEERREKLSKEAVEYVKRFDWGRIAKGEAEVYKTILNLSR